jgi:hypothetical protein
MAFGFDVNNYGTESEYMYMLPIEDIIDEPHHDETLIAKKLPTGNWQIVCTSKEATEDDCAIIAGLSFQDVVHGYSRTFFHDLLTSKGCDLKKSYLILKKTA